MYCYVGHHIQSLAKLSVGCWLKTRQQRPTTVNKMQLLYHLNHIILFHTVSTQSSMLSIFHASCCISLILWCTLFSWHGQSSGPEVLKEECGMGKSEQSQVTTLTDVLTHNLLPCQADMQQTVTVTSTTEAFCVFFFFGLSGMNQIQN